MSYGMEDRETVTRRVLVRRGVVLLSAVAAVATQAQRASGTIKISKAAVAYQDHPEGANNAVSVCSSCRRTVAKWSTGSSARKVSAASSPRSSKPDNEVVPDRRLGCAFVGQAHAPKALHRRLPRVVGPMRWKRGGPA
jgi:hypothetical protein